MASEMFEGLSRRGLIAAAAAVTGGTALAQSAPATGEKGPIVWLDMDQKALDDAYDQSVYAPNDAQIRKRRIANSQLVRQRLGEPKRFAYGSTPIEGLDVFTAAKPNAPQYRIHVSDAGASMSQVQVQNAQGSPEGSGTGKRILTLLYEQLK